MYYIIYIILHLYILQAVQRAAYLVRVSVSLPRGVGLGGLILTRVWPSRADLEHSTHASRLLVFILC